MNKDIVIVGAGVTGIFVATKLLKNGYPGKKILIIDKGKDPYERQPEEVMNGFLGAGLYSDGKIVYLHNQIGGQLAKYCGEKKSTELVNEVMKYIKEFHPNPKKVMLSNPAKEPKFIKPYFQLRMAPTYHIGTDYLHEMGKKWYDWLVKKGVEFLWKTEISDIDFNKKIVSYYSSIYESDITEIKYRKLIYATGKSGIDFTNKLVKKHEIETETKPVQIGVRFEAPQKYFQKIINTAYDFKLYRKFEEEGVSLRTFCVNNNAAFVAVEETYNKISYNGHAKKDDKYKNGMTNFGIIMEIRNKEKPFEWSMNIVEKCQHRFKGVNSGLYYSPSRKPSKTSEGKPVICYELNSLDYFKYAYKEYAEYIIDFIVDLNKIFKFGNDWGIYFPEVKFLSDEVLVNYKDLSLKKYPNVHFGGDSLSARGIAVSAAQGLYIGEALLGGKKNAKQKGYRSKNKSKSVQKISNRKKKSSGKIKLRKNR